MSFDKAKRYNKALCKRFPFLIPTNAWSGRKITDGAGFWPGSPDSIPEYDYEYTKYDEIPIGWRKAFGIKFCKELKRAIKKLPHPDEYYVAEIKEKYGRLCWYDYGGSAEIDHIVRKYCSVSERTCIVCGKKATRITTGWICPYCKQHVPKYDGYEVSSVDIDSWYQGCE